MRPRKIATDLPPRVYHRHGRYWYVHCKRWLPLSKDKDDAIRQAAKLDIDRGPGWSREVQNALEIVYRARRRDAKTRGVLFMISVDDVLESARSTQWRCAITDIPFKLDRPHGKRRAPMSPSIDRIDGSKGYVHGNVRVVCLAANLAMNEWGDSVMQQLAEGWLKAEFRRRLLDSPKPLTDESEKIQQN